MNLYLEPLMTGLPKLSCYHRAYFNDDSLIIDLGTTLYTKGFQQFSKEIISGTRSIQSEIRFTIDEELSEATEADKEFETGITYRVKSGNQFVAFRTRINYSVLTNYVRFNVVTNNKVNNAQSKDGSSIINIKGTGTKVSDSDLYKVVSLINECLEWRNTHHVTTWK